MLPTIWLQALLGGALIGAAAVLLMLGLGRIAGISGIVGGLLPPVAPDRMWRGFFLVGLLAGPMLVGLVLGRDPVGVPAVGMPMLAAAGLLVGLGTGFGSGCTSGHGVCGLARLSPRSIAATAVFMLAGAATVFVVRHWLG
jgi:uncharacterized membrane protein YedE/YeeE